MAHNMFTPEDILVRGFSYASGLKELTINDYNKATVKKFKEHYGLSPSILALIWDDIDASIKSEKGFKKLLTALHFLWAYPKNAGLLASRMTTHKRDVEGRNLWQWVNVIAKLKELKIVWPEEEYNNPNGQVYIVSVDGVDFKVWEKQHPEFPYDKGQYSHKINHGALKYEIAIDCHTSKVVWINGPYRGGEHDKNIYCNGGLRDMIPEGKKVVVDRVYGTKKTPDDHAKLSLPNLCDDKKTANFKARLRC